MNYSISEDFENRKKFIADISQTQFLARLIDSTLLKTNATKDDFIKLCLDANKHHFKSVCIPPSYISLAKEYCQNVLVCTVIGFPNGYTTTQNKILETKEAILIGADEIDFVQNVTCVKSNDWDKLEFEYKGILSAADGKVTKIILETSLLTPEEIEKCTKIAVNCGIHIIKTSTGFGSRGATQNDINIIQSTIQSILKENTHSNLSIGIKASGGVRLFEDAVNMIQCGATRIGTSNGVQMLIGKIS